MRTLKFALLLAFVFASAPAYADSDLTFTLDFGTGSGSSTSLKPDADTCLPPNCVLFSGTLSDTDTDLSDVYLTSISVTFSTTPSSGALTVDNTFYDDVPGVLSGDPDYASDELGNPPNIYDGPIFGIDIAPDTSPGAYTGTVTIGALGGTNDPDYNGFTVTADITVVVTPEPATGGLALVGLAAFAKRGWVIRKWHSSAASR